MMPPGRIFQWKGDPQKPPLVCLHGFLGTGADFEIVANHYTNHPTLLAPDFPDFTTEPVRSDHPWAETLEMLNTFIDKETDGRPCILVGYSMGGRIALQYALKYQHLMTGLVLIGATPGIEDESERTSRTKQDEERVSTLLNEPIEAFLDSWFKQKLISSQQRITEPYRSKMQQARYSQNKDALAYYLTALGTGSMNPAWNQLNELHIPTLLITGEEDTKFTSIAQKMVRSLANANFETLTGAGHAACFENPIEFAHRLERFIENCPS